jgi:hypothetical protein
MTGTDWLAPIGLDGNVFGYVVPFTWAASLRPVTGSGPDVLTGTGTAGSSPTNAAALTPVLYLQEAGDTAAISVTDINQGQIGDCYLCSSIGELALFHPSWITKMIHVNADGTETVTLYRAANGSLPTWGTTSFTPISMTVTNDFPGYSVNNGATQDVYNGQKEIWVQVLEKAVATLYGGYAAIGNGGWPSIAMEELRIRREINAPCQWKLCRSMA